MAGGYVGYGSSLGARVIPNTTMHPQTLASPVPYPTPQQHVPWNPPLDERNARKRRRLDVFRRETLPRPANLRPVDVAGRGRMLLDFAEAEAEAVAAGCAERLANADTGGVAGGVGRAREPNRLGRFVSADVGG